MKKKWNKIKTPNTPPVKDETGKTALKYILSNGSKNIVLWIRHGTSLDLKEIIIGGYADRGFELVHTYDKEIDSQRADMKNIGSTRFGGSIQAAQFLYRFIDDNFPWSHLDIAGVTWSKKGYNNSFTKLHSSGATAFGVRLIDRFLL